MTSGSAMSNETTWHRAGYANYRVCKCTDGHHRDYTKADVIATILNAAASRQAELQEAVLRISDAFGLTWTAERTEGNKIVHLAQSLAAIAGAHKGRVQALQEELDAARAELADERAARMEESQEVGRLESLNDAVMDGNKKLKAANATLTERAALADEIAIHLREVFPLSQAGWLARYDALAK